MKAQVKKKLSLFSSRKVKTMRWKGGRTSKIMKKILKAKLSLKTTSSYQSSVKNTDLEAGYIKIETNQDPLTFDQAGLIPTIVSTQLSMT